jgi:DNA-binding beta-propeller fold protein YncE
MIASSVVIALAGTASGCDHRTLQKHDPTLRNGVSTQATVDGGPDALQLPLVLVGDVDLPGRAVRFDYQAVDEAQQHLVIAHMNDDAVLILKLEDGSLAKRLPGIATPRGVAVADQPPRIFVTSISDQLVIIDGITLDEVARVATGRAPDGVAWDPIHQVVGVSDQSDGAVSLIADAGMGQRTQLPLGKETGNVAFDAVRNVFWVAVVRGEPPDQLVAIDPASATIVTRHDLPGCDGAHGVRVHPDGQRAWVACEDNARLVQVDLAAGTLATAKVGKGPDVLALDPALGWLYVAAESGELHVFDVAPPDPVRIDSERPGDNAHSVAVDPATHRVFFPLMKGPSGKPVLRIMRPH